ncbi:MAG: amino acid adenylation domain-containing protein [Nocardiaceae bacterium]|nr:amino acid adenylation domain-containing protein [Nocardiaceae bacterium]
MTVLSQTPSAFYQLARADAETRHDLALRRVVFGGEALEAVRLADWVDRRGDDRPELINMFGITETCVHVTWHRVTAAEIHALRAAGSVIGVGLPGIGVRVLDDRLHPVPVGVVGELYVSGPQVARGYRHRPALTASRFVADPLAPSQRMYRSGDRVRWTPDGDLEYLGRTDFQVQVRGFRVEPGEVEAALVAVPGVASAVVLARAETAGAARLLGYVVPEPGASVTAETVLASAAQRLPSYTVPSVVTVLEEFPLTPNGKIDRAALPDPRPVGGQGRPPATDVERILAELFADVLGTETVGVDDSFFGLGGDSIMSIQLVSRAKTAGVTITPRDVFECRTVARLADVAVRVDHGGVEPLPELPGGGVGDVATTPIVRWLAERPGDFGRYSQSVLLDVPPDLDPAALSTGVQAVLDRHDMLRALLRRDQRSRTGWRMSVRPAGAVHADAVVRTVSVATVQGPEFTRVARGELDAAADRLDPFSGSMIQFVWFTAPDGARLLVVAHHLAIDGVSWRILVPDLAVASTRADAGEDPALPAVGTSMRTWADGLASAARSRSDELGLWRSMTEPVGPGLGARELDPRVDVGATTDRVEVELSAEVTRGLTTTLPRVFHGSVDDGLLSALALAVVRWRRERGVDVDAASVALEGHGREDQVLPGADLARTVGWFTSLYPVRFDLSGIDVDAAMSGAAPAGTLVKTVKETMRSIPDHGIGFGLLRYLNEDTGPELSARPLPEIGFNYLGRFDAGAEAGTGGTWRPVDDSELRGVVAPDLAATAVIDVNAAAVPGPDGPHLTATWDYPRGILSSGEVERLAQWWIRAAEALVDHAGAPGAGGLTPSDLDLVSLDQTAIDLLEHRYPGLSDVWPLSPMQRGMMFHSELSAAADAYLVQLVLKLGGTVEVPRLQRAARALLGRHSNLRTAFVRGPGGDAVQVVQDSVDVPWAEVDLGGYGEPDAVARMSELLDADRTTPFDLSRAPLIRITLVHMPGDAERIVITNHHILFDGWSTPLLLEELFTLYEADGDPSGLPTAGSYRRFLWWLTTRDEANALRAWTDAVAGAVEPTLLADRSATADRYTESRDLLYRLDAATTDRLRARARQQGITLSTVVQTAWGIVLGLLTGRDDVVFGATVSGRPPDLAGVESAVGLFINTVPVRIRLDSYESLGELLERVQAEQSTMLDHHHAGLDGIQRAAGPGAVFDTLTVFESYPLRDGGAGTEIGGLRIVGIEACDSAHYPLSVVAVARDRLHVTMKFRPDVLAESRVAAIAQRLLRVLRSFADDPDLRLAALDHLTDAERREFVPVSAGSGSPPQTLAAILDAAAARDPEALALIGDGREVTYGELDSRSNRLARYLADLGIGPESLVVLGIPRSIESVLTVWAVARTGAAFVPVDPDYPPERVANMLADCGAEIGVTTREFRSKFPGSVHWIELDDPDVVRACARRPSGPVTDRERTAPIRIDHPAYLIYTSGSTGRPKAVTLTQRGLANYADAQRARSGVTADARTLHFSSPSFDVSLLEYLLCFAAAATMVIVPRTVYGGTELTAVLRKQRVTHAFITPAAIASVDPSDLDDLECVLIGGESWQQELADDWLPQCRVLNVYGPTETTIVVNIEEYTGQPRLTMGRPIPGVAETVVDGRLQPVPADVEGDVYIAGPGLARGYHRRPGLTAARFVANPFGEPGERMYRTGDVGAWTPDGTLEYRGRSDFQVKIRGFRIELGEIDSVLSAHPDVRFAVTLGRRGPGGDTVLVSYVAATPGHIVTADALRARLMEHLPEYMVPAAVEVLETIPLTPVGKLDRRALPEPEFGMAATAFRAPTNPVEEAVTDVFAEVLGAGRVGAADNFFDLGGNSLSATRAVARLGEVLGIDLGVRALFEAPTAVALAERIEHDGTGPSGRPVLEPAERPAQVPLSAAQQRMWFINQYDPSSAAYNVPMVIRLSGALDAAALAAAVVDVIDRHEALRTAFPIGDAGPVQDVRASADAGIVLEPVPVAESEVPDRVRAVATAGFDVTEEVPVRGELFEVGPDTHVLVLVAHHILIDGYSAGPLATDLMRAYAARAAGHRPDWAALRVQYADYTLWQRDLLGDADDPRSLMARQLAYWTRTLSGAPDLLGLPTDRPRPIQQSFRGGWVEFTIDADLHRRLQLFARGRGASLFMAIHTALAVLLSRLGDTDDIVIGTPIAGRGERILDDLVGMFVGTLALRTRIDARQSFAQLIDLVREIDLGAFGHADVPFERVVEELAPARSTAYSPLFQVALEFQDGGGTRLALPGLTLEGMSAGAEMIKGDLEVVLTEQFDDPGALAGIAGSIAFATDLFDPETVHGFAERFVRILESALADPERAVGDLEILAARELTGLAPARGGPDAEPVLLTDLLAAAARDRDAVAVTYQGVPTTYGELDAHSNRLARYLIGLGAGPESYVALGLSRSPESVLALWAVAKTGAAFVPVDPDYPAARITQMLTDSGAALGVTVRTCRERLPNAVDWSVLDDPVTAAAVAALSAAPVTASDLISPVRVDHPAYLIYTSGSTGTPKGVVLTHRGLADLAIEERDHLAVTPSARTLNFASPSFDASVFETVMALSAGAAMVVVPTDVYGGTELGSLLETERVTHGFVTPTALASVDPVGQDSLRTLVVAGEACPPELVARWAPGRTMLNAYGPTETTIMANISTPMRPGEPVSFGGPIRGVTELVLDGRLHPVPRGVVGELYISGPALARGYHGRPGLTASCFVANPWGRPGERLYRTGDLVRWRSDGTIEYIGRSDFQVKVRGFRIEPGEVDAVLGAQPDVGFSVTLTRPGPAANMLLCSYVHPAGDADLHPDDLRRAAAQHLPAYMVPASVTVLDRIPLSPTGKLDRDALPQPSFVPSAAAATREPDGPVETAVVQSFSEVLGVGRVGVDDSFFDLGGTSLLATRVVSDLRARLGSTVPLQALFLDPTPAGLAGRITAVAPGGIDEALAARITLRAGGSGRPLFCVHPGIGLSWGYGGLLRHLPADRPVFGLQLPAIAGGARYSSIEDLAARYVDEMVAAAPDGPYDLLGWSLGGVLAHAMAVEVQRRGRSVTMLAVMDAYPDDGSAPLLDRLDLADLLRGLGLDVAAAQELTYDTAARMFNDHFGISDGITADHLERIDDGYVNSRLLVHRFVPDVFDGNLLVFQAVGDRDEARRSPQEWRRIVTGGIDECPVDCGHNDMVDPDVLAAIGPVLAAYLER